MLHPTSTMIKMIDLTGSLFCSSLFDSPALRAGRWAKRRREDIIRRHVASPDFFGSRRVGRILVITPLGILY
jgi:hypothetical protein